MYILRQEKQFNHVLQLICETQSIYETIFFKGKKKDTY